LSDVVAGLGDGEKNDSGGTRKEPFRRGSKEMEEA